MELDDAGSGIPRPSRPRAHNREKSTNPPGSKADNMESAWHRGDAELSGW